MYTHTRIIQIQRRQAITIREKRGRVFEGEWGRVYGKVVREGKKGDI